MGKIKVLIVDDHIIIRDGLKSMLANNELVEVIGTSDCIKNAIEIIKKNHENIDVILMDINMPIIDGIEGTELIIKKFNNSKILALTMCDDESSISKMIKAGASGYLLKNSELAEIIKAIITIAKGEKYYSNQVSNTMIDSLMNNNNESKPFLSEREIDILKRVAIGLSNKIIGEQLFISSRTVESHRRNILDKLNLNNTIEMVRYAIDNNLI